MGNLEMANLCYKTVEEMMKYINRAIEYHEVSEEVRDFFEGGYSILHETTVFWLKEQGELEVRVMSYKKTCQIYLKELSFNEVKQFITKNSEAYIFLKDIVDEFDPKVKEQIEALGVAQKLMGSK